MILILTILWLFWGLGTLLNILNIKAMQPVVPALFQNHIKPDEYARSQQYTLEKTKFSIFTSTFDLAVLTIFCLAHGFNFLNELVLGYGLSQTFSGLLFFGAIALASDIISIPFDLYATFVIEERYGFNKTTPKTFWMDRLKNWLLLIVLGGTLLGTILTFFYYTGNWAWLLCWIFTAVFTLIIQLIAPSLLLPLFNKFTPLEDGPLRDALNNLSSRAGFALKEIFVMDGSKRSSKGNAFFTGFGSRKRIALFDTLIQKMSTEETTAVLAHEIGHYKGKHILKGMIVAWIQSGLVFFVMNIIIQNNWIYGAFSMQTHSLYAGLLFFGIIYSPLGMLLAPFSNRISCRFEFEADAYAAGLISGPEAMISALKNLSVDSLSNLTPHPAFAAFNYSHPPVLERIKALSNFTGAKASS